MTRITLLVFLLLTVGSAQAQPISIGKLSSENCYDPDPKVESSSENQRYWFPRVPPYVGYSKGERTTAGGDGTCYLGFPKVDSNSALVMVNEKIITVFPDVSNKQNGLTIFKSRDEKTVVELKVTGGASTCEPDADKCCGNYTYATITITNGSKKSSVMAAQYSGG